MVTGLLARVYVTPKRGILDPQGKAVQQSLHALGFAEVGDVRVGKYVELRLRDVDRAAARERACAAMCEQLLANGVIEDFRVEIVEERRVADALGRGHLPGLERRPRHAARRRARPRRRRGAAVAQGPTTCTGVDCVVLPGGFSYGDYLRCGAIARFSPDHGGGRRGTRSAGGLVLGICNGFQILCEAGLLPGALVRNRGLPLRLRRGHGAGRDHRHAVHLRLPRAASVLDAADQARRGLLRRRRGDARGARGERPGRLPLRRSRGALGARGQPERLAREHRRHLQRGPQRPRADAASRARRRAARGRRGRAQALPLRAGMARRRGSRRAGASRRWCPGPDEPRACRRSRRSWPPSRVSPRDEYARIVDAARPHADVRGARRLRRDVVRALLVQELARATCSSCPTTGPHVLQGPGRERRRGRHRRRTRGGLQDREPQPSVVRRAVPGRGDRRRRHPARHLHDGRAADRHPRLAALRQHRPSAHAATWCAASSPASATTATASACRRSAARSYFDPAYDHNILVNAFTLGIAPRRSALPRAARRASATRSSTSARGPAATASTAPACSRRPSSTPSATEKRPTVQVGDPFTEKLLLEACLELDATEHVVAIQDMGAAGLTSSLGRDGRPRRHRHRARSRRGAAARGGHDAVRDPALRVAGAHAAGGACRQPRTRSRAIFARWDLEAAVIGRVTDDGMFRVRAGTARRCARSRSTALTDAAPVYRRPAEEPGAARGARSASTSRDLREPDDLDADAAGAAREPEPVLARVGVPAVRPARRRRTPCVRPGADAAVVRIDGTRRALALTRRLQPRYGRARSVPRRGPRGGRGRAQRASPVGARPLAVTDCLNFGNPENARRHVGVPAGRSPASATPASRSARPSSAAT